MDDDLVILEDDEPKTDFRRVLRGYDPQQVETILDQYDASLDQAEARHAEDVRRVTALEQQVGELTERLQESERRASGRPETPSAIGERLRQMLTLAEQEAAALRASAREEADALLAAAREEVGAMLASAQEQAAVDTAERTKALEQREREVERAQREAEAARLEAQKDAEQVRTRAQREAERELEQARARADALRADAEHEIAQQLETAREDVRLLHEHARREVAGERADAQREVHDLGRQRDALVGQLSQLRDMIAAAVGPAVAPAPEPPRGGSARVEPGA